MLAHEILLEADLETLSGYQGGLLIEGFFLLLLGG